MTDELPPDARPSSSKAVEERSAPAGERSEHGPRDAPVSAARAHLQVSPGVLERGCVAVVHLGQRDDGRAMTAIVARDASGVARAYRNICEHLPIPLSGLSHTLDAADHDHFVCFTHGARFRVSDGHCVSGPCDGKRLESLESIENEGAVEIRVPDDVTRVRDSGV